MNSIFPAAIPLAIGAIFFLGWIVPMIAGITRIRSGTGGVILTSIAGLWLLLAVAAGALIGVALTAVNWDEDYYEESFNPEEYEGAVATLTYDQPGSCSLWAHIKDSEFGGNMLFESDNGEITVPAGTLVPSYCEFTVTAEDGTTSSAGISPGSSAKSISISEGEQKPLPFGLDMTAKIKVSAHSGNQAGFDLKITDSAGNRCTIRTGKATPGFKVLDSEGREVWHGKFSYG